MAPHDATEHADPEATPAAAKPRPSAARLLPLAKFPIFMDLAGRRVLVAGGGPPVVWKAELLAAAGARLAVLAEEPAPELVALAAARPESIMLERRAWEPGDLAGAALAVADIEEAEEAARFAAAARAAGVPVNVVDKPAFCEFQFGTVVNRSPVVVGIMTDGAAPIVGQAIRRRIEAILPATLAQSVAAAKAFRDRLKALLPGRSDRRTFWEGFVDAALGGGAAAQDAASLERLAGRVAAGARGGRVGEVAIVGAGPGDPELLTLRAMRELQAADVIVHDRLVTPAILELGRREARRIHVGKEGHGASCRQEDISALLVDLAIAGERVVRLKGGDPAIFGRTGEEVAACREAGVPVRIVPGVTSASAAAASLDFSLTHRDRASRVQFVTGHDRHGRLPADLDIAALADPRATLVVYMGRRTAPALARALVAAGRDPATPVLAVADVARPSQRDVRLDLGRLGEGVPLPEGVPVLVLIGDAVRDAAPAAAGATAEAT